MGRKASSSQAGATSFSQLQIENEALKKEVAELHRKLERMSELLLNGKRIIIPRPQKTGGLNRGPQRLPYFSQHRQPAFLHSMAKKHSDLPGLDFFRGMAIPSVPEADKHRAQGR